MESWRPRGQLSTSGSWCWLLLCDFQLFTSPGLSFLIYSVKDEIRWVVFKPFKIFFGRICFIQQYLKTETACIKDTKIALFCLNPQRVSLPVPLHISGPTESYFEIPGPRGARSENHRMRSPPGFLPALAFLRL